MRKSNAAWPKNSLILKSYAELESYVDAFAQGHLNLLILVGPPGVAKSRTVRARLGDTACWLEGNATAFGIYTELYRHRDAFVVIDDVDSLYSDRNGIRLCKCLCQTDEVKSVAWHSAVRVLEKAGIPRQFETRSRVIIISNDWKTLNRNVAALQDRGHVLAFCPTASEVHQKAVQWFQDQEILAWFESNLARISEPSLRLYVRAAELKRSGLEWRDVIPVSPENTRKRLITEIISNPALETSTARIAQFTSQGGGCRATYYNYLRLVR
jgi:hypothetical protein